MQQDYIISPGRNAISGSGILKVFFDAFSLRNGHKATYTNSHKQSRSIGFKLFTFTGKERDPETGYSYFGARYYDCDLSGLFLSVDPMADKYPSISPYAYCAWNPLKLVDPDGNKIRYAPGTSVKFKRQFRQTVKYMNQKGTAGILAKLEQRREVIYLAETNDKHSRFDPKTNTIFWNPSLGVLTDNDVVLSPATVLNHEADHALQEYADPVQKTKDKSTKDSQYTNREEKRVITGSEQETARKHGEIKGNEVTRENHNGIPYETVSPTSTERKAVFVKRASKQIKTKDND